MSLEIEEFQPKIEPPRLMMGVTSSSFSSEYSNFLGVPKEDSCAFVYSNVLDRHDAFYTEVRNEFLLFTKSNLSEAAINLLTNKATTIPGIWVFDEYEWDDSIPGGLTGDGVWVCKADITLTPDKLKSEPVVSFVLKDDEVFVERMVKKLTAYRKTYPLLSFDKDKDDVLYIIGSGMVDESGGGSHHDIDNIVFSKKDFSKLILTAAVSPGRSAKIVTEAKETADIEHWSYGTVDGRSFHCQDKPIKVELSMKIGYGYSSEFNLKEIG